MGKKLKSIGNLNEKDHDQLKKFCQKNELSIVEFIRYSVKYFEKSGSNPKLDESPRDEINKLIKRLDQVIGFIKTQEKEYIRPAFEQVSIIEQRLKQDLENLTSRRDVLALSEMIKNLVDQVNKILADYKNLISKYEDRISQDMK